ncbi:MAG: Crp/Fnr family transcriptional regulator [Cyclobacteriaceae bacterium]|nr:Crp/Fnr family transcriptional regulator [Cyclobacteriaceae bacterium]
MQNQPFNTTIIDNFSFFFEEDLKKELTRVSKIYKVAAGEIIMDIGQSIDQIPLVLKGSLKISREDEEGNEILLYYLEPGHSCATSLTSCYSGQRSTIRAIAEDDSEYLAIPAQYSDEWIIKYTSWKNFVMNTYSERFEELLKTIDQLAFKKMDERLSKYLHDKADLHDNSVIHISHQEIAYDLNTSREVISRLLKQLENMGAIKLGRNRIVILD